MRQRKRISSAASRGRNRGYAAATWVFDGNTTKTTYAMLAKALDDGDPTIDTLITEPGWLSGEHAGESPNELLGDLLWPNNPDKNEEIQQAYEEAARASFWLEVGRAITRGLKQ